MAFDETKYEQGFDWVVDETINMVEEDHADADVETKLEKALEYLAEAIPDMEERIKKYYAVS